MIYKFQLVKTGKTYKSTTEFLEHKKSAYSSTTELFRLRTMDTTNGKMFDFTSPNKFTQKGLQLIRKSCYRKICKGIYVIIFLHIATHENGCPLDEEVEKFLRKIR